MAHIQVHNPSFISFNRGYTLTISDGTTIVVQLDRSWIKKIKDQIERLEEHQEAMDKVETIKA